MKNRGEGAQFPISANQEVARKLNDAATYSVFGLMGLGCWPQTWAANSLSRWASYFCFISSSDSPTNAPEGLNAQLHSEQPKPSKLWRAIHASLRGMAEV
jgi:hypothetical protein